MESQSPENTLFTELDVEIEWTVAEIRRRFVEGARPISPQMLRRMEGDPRAGVRKLCGLIRTRNEASRKEKSRLRSLLRIERRLRASGVSSIAGVDEVGVGPLAGPVVAAAVVFPPGAVIQGVDDSKRLREEERERLAPLISEQAQGVGIGLADVHEIDELNVYQAALLSMRRAIENLPLAPEHILVDARSIPGLDIPQSSLKKGDQASFSIAAASIVAKTHRDGLMRELDQRHPEYGFRRHKGYGTPEHQKAIRRHGLLPMHRKSFLFLEEVQGEYSALFYQLKTELAKVGSEEGLRGLEKEFLRYQSGLERQESRKLRILLGRRRQQIEGRDGT